MSLSDESLLTDLYVCVPQTQLNYLRYIQSFNLNFQGLIVTGSVKTLHVHAFYTPSQKQL